MAHRTYQCIEEGYQSLDITEPDTPVQVAIRKDGTVVHVNVDGRCVLRVCRCYKGIEVEDAREFVRPADLKEGDKVWLPAFEEAPRQAVQVDSIQGSFLYARGLDDRELQEVPLDVLSEKLERVPCQ